MNTKEGQKQENPNIPNLKLLWCGFLYIASCWFFVQLQPLQWLPTLFKSKCIVHQYVNLVEMCSGKVEFGGTKGICGPNNWIRGPSRNLGGGISAAYLGMSTCTPGQIQFRIRRFFNNSKLSDQSKVFWSHLDIVKVKIIKFLKIFRMLRKFIYRLILVHYISPVNG